MLSRAKAAVRPTALAVIVCGWLGAGIVSGAITSFEVVQGAALMGAVGGAVTAVALFGKPNRGFLLSFAGSICAHLAGALVAAKGGGSVAPWLGSVVGTKYGGFAAWAMIWGCSGAVVGVIAGAAVLVALRGAEFSRAGESAR